MSLGYDTQRVTTADNVGISFRVAGLATRITAAAIDLVILAVLLFAVFTAIAAIASAMGGDSAAAQVNASFLSLLLAALLVVVVVAYFTVSQAVSAGRTAGKAVMGIRVIRLEGGTPTLGESFLRSLAYAVDLLGVGVILMFFHPQSRRLGDLLAGTVVVRERTPVTLAVASAANPVYLRSFEAGPPIDGLGRLGEREFQAVRTFLGRPGLVPAQRVALAARLAAPLLERMALPPSAPERMWPPELLLERVYLQLVPRFGR
jgi:uncharacterized RDD family membrane protein YckC